MKADGKFGVVDGRGEIAELYNRDVHRGSMHWHWKYLSDAKNFLSDI